MVFPLHVGGVGCVLFVTMALIACINRYAGDASYGKAMNVKDSCRIWMGK